MKKIVLLVLLVSSNLLPMLKKEVFYIDAQSGKISRSQESCEPGIWSEVTIENDTKHLAVVSTYKRIKITNYLQQSLSTSIMIDPLFEDTSDIKIGIKYSDKKIKLLCPKKRPDQLGANDHNELTLKISDIISAIKQ